MADPKRLSIDIYPHQRRHVEARKRSCGSFKASVESLIADAIEVLLACPELSDEELAAIARAMASWRRGRMTSCTSLILRLNDEAAFGGNALPPGLTHRISQWSYAELISVLHRVDLWLALDDRPEHPGEPVPRPAGPLPVEVEA